MSMKDLVVSKEDKQAKIEKAVTAARESKLSSQEAYTVAKPSEVLTAYMTMGRAGNGGKGADVAKAAFTQAALDITNACNVSAKGTITHSTKPFNRELFDALFNDGGKVYRYHNDAGRLNENGLTKDGVVWFHNRLNGKGPAFNTHLEAIKVFATLMAKGGKRSKFSAGEGCPTFPVAFSYKVAGQVAK